MMAVARLRERIVAAVLFSSAILFAATVTQPAKGEPISGGTGPLDGSTFSASIVADGTDAAAPLIDELHFRNGMFSSAICSRYNFSETAYWVRQQDGQVHFLAEMTSPTDGRMVWQGTVRGDVLEGTMRWTRTRWYWTIDAEHRIRGTLEKRPGDGPTGSE